MKITNHICLGGPKFNYLFSDGTRKVLTEYQGSDHQYYVLDDVDLTEEQAKAVENYTNLKVVKEIP
jgi:hypothetical protein